MWTQLSIDNVRRSKGYGFVSFRTPEAAENGIALMNGKLVGHRCVYH